MKIAILGGAFDPPHLGHQLIADQVLDFVAINEVWLTPCYSHTFNKKMSSVSHRVAMTKMITGKNIRCCEEEIINKLPGDTIDLMKILKKKYRLYEFLFIIGSDNLRNFKKWGQWKKLITTFNFLVFPRAESKSDLSYYKLDNPSHKFHFIHNSLLVTSNISSTNIRTRVKNNRSIRYMVPSQIETHIKRYNLYKNY